MSEGSELHKGHRKRILDRFMRDGIASLEEHEILEIILFSIIPRCNTNDISHRLINKFGSIMGVLSASKSDLLSINGIGDNAAAYLCFLGSFVIKYRKESLERRKCLNSLDKILEYGRTLFTNQIKETVFVIYLDNSMNLICSENVSEGSADMANFDIKVVVAKALNLKSSKIVLLHNHPSGNATFSSSDVNATRSFIFSLEKLGISLIDHIIVTASGYCSMNSQDLIDNNLW